MSEYYNRQWRLPNNENKNKQSNYSMDFDGSSYINAGSIDITGNKTLSMWFKTSNISTNQGLFEMMPDPNTSDYLIVWVYNGKIEVDAANSGSSAKASSVLSSNTWYNLVIIKTSGVINNVYINGVDDTQTGAGLGFVGGRNNLYIGATYQGTQYANEFIGQIDGVSIYNYALSSSQVTTLYGSSSTGIGNPMSLSPKPVAFYPLGDQDSFNGSSYLTPNASLKDYVFSFGPSNSNKINLGNIFPTNSNMSVSVWFKYTGTVSTNDMIIGARPTDNDRNYLTLQDQGTNSRRLDAVIRRNGENAIVASKEDILPDIWHNAVYTISVSGSTKTVKLYVNGTLEATSSGTLGDTPSGSVYLGWMEQRNAYGGPMEISNAQIFNTALPATGSNSVETLYNNGSPLTSMSGYSSLQGWWKLDASDTYDGTNWTIADNSSNSNTGTSSGMTQANLVQSDLSFTSGYSPYALSFDGTNDYIQTTFNPYTSIGDNTSWTVSSWVYVSNVTNQQRILGAYSTSNTKRFFFGIISSGIAVGYGNRSFNPISGTSVIANSWQNIIVTYSTTTGYISVYINGSLNGSKNYLNPQDGYANGDEIMANANISIGDSVGDSNHLNGSISNVSIWNAALTSSQVTEIYAEGVPQNLNNHSAYSNLVSWWQLGSNSSFNSSLNQWTCIDEKGTNTGVSSQTFNENAIVDGVGSYANGLSSGMGGDEVVGSAFGSSANALSISMDISSRTTDVPS